MLADWKMLRGIGVVLFTFTMTLLGACAPDVPEVPSFPRTDGGVVVGFYAGSGQTRTSVCDDGINVNWSAGDSVCVWAQGENGIKTLDGNRFSLTASDNGRAWFSASLSSPMPQGNYQYYAAYPVPVSVAGTAATFSVPSVQDGKAGSGADIMIASPVSHGPLSATGPVESHDGLSLRFNHLIHLLRFYFPQGALAGFKGEGVTRVEVSMPRAVVGQLVSDYTDPSARASLVNGTASFTLEMEDPVFESSSARDYACAAIAPTSFASGETMSIKLYSATKVAYVDPISLEGRSLEAGHATAVALNPSRVSDFYSITFTISANNLGEDVQSVTLTAPEGCRWSDGGSNVFVLNPGRNMGVGETFTLEYEDEASFRSLTSADVTVTYESEHAIISETLRMPDLRTSLNTSVSLSVPYLLFEDFSTVPSFSSNDAYATSSAGSKSAHSFLDGWTGGRIGAEAGKCIRIACRRETSADYDARVDSAPLAGMLKGSANLEVTFDYGADSKYGGIPIITDGNVGQDCYIGYVTSTTAYKSGATDGTFESGNTFYVKEYDGSYTNTPNNRSFVLHSVPRSDILRISWRTEVEHQAGTTNTTAWLYLDNITVKIAK